MNFKNLVLKKMVGKYHKAKLYNTSELKLLPSMALAKTAEDLFRELFERYSQDIVEASMEIEGKTLKSPAATPMKRPMVDDGFHQTPSPKINNNICVN